MAKHFPVDMKIQQYRKALIEYYRENNLHQMKSSSPVGKKPADLDFSSEYNQRPEETLEGMLAWARRFSTAANSDRMRIVGALKEDKLTPYANSLATVKDIKDKTAILQRVASYAARMEAALHFSGDLVKNIRDKLYSRSIGPDEGDTVMNTIIKTSEWSQKEAQKKMKEIHEEIDNIK